MTVKADDNMGVKKRRFFWRCFGERSRWIWIALVFTLFLMATVVGVRNSIRNVRFGHGAPDIIAHEVISQLAQQVFPEILNSVAEDSRLQRDDFDQLIIERYIDRLEDRTLEPCDRAAAAYLCSTFGADAKPAVPALTEALTSEDVSVRIAVAYALGCIRPSAENAVAALKKEIENEKHPLGIRVIFAEALGKIGPAAVSAVAALKHLLDSMKAARKTSSDVLTDQEFDTVAIALDRIQVHR